MSRIGTLIVSLLLISCANYEPQYNYCGARIPRAYVSYDEYQNPPQLEGDEWSDLALLLKKTQYSLSTCKNKLILIDKWDAMNHGYRADYNSNKRTGK